MYVYMYYKFNIQTYTDTTACLYLKQEHNFKVRSGVVDAVGDGGGEL